jgi:hypothetical protein
MDAEQVADIVDLRRLDADGAPDDWRGNLWLEDRKGREELAKTVGIPGQESPMARGESSNEHVGNRASWRFPNASFLNMKRPCSAGALGVFRRPAHLVVNTQLEKEFLQRCDLAGKCRSHLHER